MSSRELMPLGDDLKRCEKVIARAMEAVGNARLAASSAFLEIRDGYCTHANDSKGNPKKGLYHERGYTRFDTYCASEWHQSARDVNRVIAAAAVRDEIGKEVGPNGLTLPDNEAQLRELAKAAVPAEAWIAVVEEHGSDNVTAAVIREHVQRASGAIEVQQGVVQMTVSHSDRVLLALTHAVTAALQIATQDVVLDVVMEAMAVK